jgi:hypothetical protein
MYIAITKLAQKVYGLCLVLTLLSFASIAQSEIQAFKGEANKSVILVAPEFNNFISPVKVDDFEAGVSGSTLTGWDTSSNAGLLPVYSNKASITGGQSGLSRFIGDNYNSTAEIKTLNGLKVVYLSYFVRLDQLNGAASRNLKLARLSVGYDGAYKKPTGITLFGHHQNGIAYNFYSKSENNTKWMGNYADGEWHRVQQYIVLSSSAGASDGAFFSSVDKHVVVDEDGLVTDATGDGFNWLTLPYYRGSNPGGDYNVYYDNVYVGASRSRVEACSAPTFSACETSVLLNFLKHESEQSIHLNLSSDTPKFLYVFDENNALLNDQGIDISEFKRKSDPMPPSLMWK